MKIRSKFDLILVVIFLMIIATGLAEIISWDQILSDLTGPSETLTAAAGQLHEQLMESVRLTVIP